MNPIEPATTPPAPAQRIRQPWRPTPQAVEAVLASIVAAQGEPLTDPVRITLSLSRPAIERAAIYAGRLTFEYIQDELNPAGRLDISILE